MSSRDQSKKRYSKEFKQEAVRLANEPEANLAQIARDLGIGDSTLCRWRAEARKDGDDAFPGKGNQTPEKAELTRLRRELARVKQERDILKKAITFFREDV